MDAELTNLSQKQYEKPKGEILPLSPEAFEYLTKVRKISADTLSAFRIGCNKQGEIVIPFFDEKDQLCLIKNRDAKGGTVQRKRQGKNGWESYEVKSWTQPNGKPILFGSHLLDLVESRELVLCFGELDAMIVAQCGFLNVVSVPNGDKGLQWITTQWKTLDRFETITIFNDNDKGDKVFLKSESFQEMVKRLGVHRCKIVDWSTIEAKDANELFINGGPEQVKSLLDQSDYVQIDGLIRLADIEDQIEEKGTPTQIKEIDEVTNGFSGGQLIIIGGDNEAGKTTAMLNLVKAFTRNKEASFFWSGEQKPKQIRRGIERIFCGPDFLKEYTNHATGYTTFYPEERYLPYIRQWYADLIYIYEKWGVTTDAFFETMETAHRRYGCKLFVIDNLMAFTGGESDYFNAQGDFAENCKMFAEKWNVVVVLVCHNRKEQRTEPPTKDSIEGSKKITNWADLVIQIWRVPEGLENKWDYADAIWYLCKNRVTGQKKEVRMSYERMSTRLCEMSNPDGPYERYEWCG